MIIGLSGKIGVGKNHIGEQIIGKKLYDLGYKINFLSFGDLIKYEIGSRYDNIMNLDNLNNVHKILFLEKTKESRKILQLYATEYGRNGKNIRIDDATLYNNKHMWSKGLYLQMQNILHKSYDKSKEIFIICDVRFINEVEFIKMINGCVIRINANNRNHDKIITELTNSLNPTTEIINEFFSHNRDKIINDITNPLNSITEVVNGIVDELCYNRMKNHVSETELDNYKEFDYVIDNDYTNIDIDKNINDIFTSLLNKIIKT